MVAGLGLFFVGVWFLTENLKSLAGKKFRQSVVKITKNSVAGFGLGGLLGAVAQSMAVTIFIIVGLITAGLLTIRVAMPIIVGANFGSSVIVFLTTLNIEMIMLFVVGVSGIAVVSERLIQWKAHIGALFGAGLLFLGIVMLQSGAISVVEQPWASNLIEDVRHSYVVTFVVGCVLAFIAQTAAATSILVIALAGVGVLNFEQTVMAIYGANVGSGLVSLVLSWKLRGRPRQLAMFQILFLNLSASIIFVTLFYFEVFFDVPLVKGFVTKLSDDIEQQMAFVYFLMSFPGLVYLGLASPIARGLEQLWPPTKAEDDAKPQFIHDHATSDPDSALDLVKLEHHRLIGYFTRYFDAVRKQRNLEDEAKAALVQLHDSFLSVHNLIAELLEDIGGVKSADLIYERLNDTMNDHRTLQLIEATLFELSETLSAITPDSHLNELADTTVEALDTVLLTLMDVIKKGDEFDRQLLTKMTGDRGTVLQQIRKTYVTSTLDIEGDESLRLLRLTNLCERFFWLLGELRIDEDGLAGFVDIDLDQADVS